MVYHHLIAQSSLVVWKRRYIGTGTVVRVVVAGGWRPTNQEGLAAGGSVDACDWLYRSVAFLGIAISTIKGLDNVVTF